MKTILLLINLLGFSSLVLCQCPKFPNGDMENFKLDSFEWRKDSFTYKYKMSGWESSTCSGTFIHTRLKPDSCTYSNYAFSGNSALQVPFEQDLVLLWADAMLTDTLSGIPGGLNGYYHTKKGLDSIDTDLYIVFHNSPTNFLYELYLGDTSNFDFYYHTKLLATNGSYNNFRVDFSKNQYETDSFLIYFAFDANEIYHYFLYPEIYIDDLEFYCLPNSNVFNEALEAFTLESDNNGKSTILSNYENLISTYTIHSIDGKLIDSGIFKSQLALENTHQMLIVTVKNHKSNKIFKILPRH